MCYKYLWDNLVADDFPCWKFFDSFVLNPHTTLCEDLRLTSAESGFSSLVSQEDQIAKIIMFLLSIILFPANYRDLQCLII